MMIRALRRSSTILPIDTPCGSAMKITSQLPTPLDARELHICPLAQIRMHRAHELARVPLRCHLGQIRPRMIEQQPNRLASRISRTANHGNVVNLVFHYISLCCLPSPRSRSAISL